MSLPLSLLMYCMVNKVMAYSFHPAAVCRLKVPLFLCLPQWLLAHQHSRCTTEILPHLLGSVNMKIHNAHILNAY